MDIFQDIGSRSPLALPLRSVLDNRFKVGRLLGKPGGFGLTYLALDARLGNPVAIKEYLPRTLAGRDTDGTSVVPYSDEDAQHFRFGLDRFLQEARLLAHFNHPNIVQVRGYFEGNNTAYLVMEYYEGLTLGEYLKRKGGRVSPLLAMRLMLSVLDGLRAVHAQKMLHRDIKPDNIYLVNLKTGSWRPVLLDFGAARLALGEASRSLTAVLTPGYAPFEQYHGQGQGPWTDIYGAAATLYKIVTGSAPLEASLRVEGAVMARADEMEEDVPEELGQALEVALSVRPEDRPTTVEAFQEMLINILDDGQEELLATLVLTARDQCQVYVDGIALSELSTGATKEFVVEAGTHDVVVMRLDDEVTWHQTVSLAPADSQALTIIFPATELEAEALEQALTRQRAIAQRRRERNQSVPKEIWLVIALVLLATVLVLLLGGGKGTTSSESTPPPTPVEPLPSNRGTQVRPLPSRRLNKMPVAVDDQATTGVGQSVEIDVLANDTYDDGDRMRLALVGQATHGTAQINGEGTVTYTPQAGFTGTDRFRYMVSDVVAQATAAVTVQVTTSPPPPEEEEEEPEEEEEEPEEEEEEPEPEIFVVVEEMPELIGGLTEIHKQIRYPEIAQRVGLEGLVIVEFIVNENGSVISQQVVRGIGSGCDEEALRVIRQARFRPGKLRGRPVKVKMSLAITFKLPVTAPGPAQIDSLRAAPRSKAARQIADNARAAMETARGNVPERLRQTPAYQSAASVEERGVQLYGAGNYYQAAVLYEEAHTKYALAAVAQISEEVPPEILEAIALLARGLEASLEQEDFVGMKAMLYGDWSAFFARAHGITAMVRLGTVQAMGASATVPVRIELTYLDASGQRQQEVQSHLLTLQYRRGDWTIIKVTRQ